MLYKKLNSLVERLENKIPAIKVNFYNPDLNEAELYYFYYNQNHDPCIIPSHFGDKLTEDSIGISLPSSVHMDYDLRPNSRITEGQLAQVIKAYKILTENVLRKNIENGRVVRKRVTTIQKPKRITPLVNKVKGKKAGLYAQTAVAKAKRRRSNNVRDILNLHKQPKKDISVLESKENRMQRQTAQRFNRVNETYCTYPQARSIAVNIVAALAKKKIDGYSIKYPQTAFATVDQRGFSIKFGTLNTKWVAQEFLEDVIAKDIMGRFARGEELDPQVKNQVAVNI